MTIANMLCETLKGYRGRTAKLDVSVPFAQAMLVEGYFDPVAARYRVAFTTELNLTRVQDALELGIKPFVRAVADRRVDHARRFALAATCYR